VRPLHGPRFWGALTAILAVGVIAALIALTVPYLWDGESSPASAEGSASASHSASVSAEPTASAGSALTEQVISAAGEGWVLAAVVGPDATVTLTAIDPAGGTYPGAVLAEGSELLAWLPGGTALVYEPSAGEVSAIALTDGSTVWSQAAVEDPEVALAADGSAVVLASGAAGERVIDALDPSTGEATRLADGADRQGLVSSSDGTAALSAVGDAPASISLGASGQDESSLGTPLGASACEPYAWDEGRQAIVVCADDSTTVWALEPSTGTFAQAATLPSVGGTALAATGSRVLVADSVYGVDGTLRWALPDEAAGATSAVFTGAALAVWTSDGDGLASTVALVRSSGDLSTVVDVPDSFVGFAQVVPAP